MTKKALGLIVKMRRFLEIFAVFLFLVHFLNGQDHSLNFDGNNDYILIPDNASLDLTTNYTIEAWIFPESFSWLAGIVSKYHTNAANGYMLRLTFQAPYTGLGFDERVTGTGILSSNQWYHVAAVNSNGNRKLYVNGVEYSLSGSALNVSANNNPLRIGSDYGSRYFDGRIDEVRIWNIARGQDDIIETMDSVLTGSEAGLVAYYSFNEGSGIILNDQTGNGHNGTLVGGPQWSSGYTLSGLLGDIDFDEQLNVYDAVMLVAIMLGNEDGNDYQLYASDTNQDGDIDVADVVLLMQWILGIDIGNRDQISDGEYYHDNNSIIIDSDGEVAGFQFQFSELVPIAEMNLPSGWGWKQSGTHCIAYSMDGSSLPNKFRITFEEKTTVQHLKLAGWKSKVIEAKKVLIPDTYQLKVGPNPFNPRCNISFILQAEMKIGLDIYNLRGQFVESIFKGKLNEGVHQFYWSPSSISSGTYFIHVSNGKHSQFIKTVYLK